jgi:hypothetical protein
VEPLEIDEAVVDADLRDRVREVDVESPGAATLIWQGFLAHVRRPLAFGERFSDDDGNDLVSFSAQRTPAGDEWNVVLKRRIGVVRDEEYEGTIVAACRTRVADGPAWEGIEDHSWVEEDGLTRRGADSFQAAVEASAAFAAWTASPLRQFRAYAAYG